MRREEPTHEGAERQSFTIRQPSQVGAKLLWEPKVDRRVTTHSHGTTSEQINISVVVAVVVVTVESKPLQASKVEEGKSVAGLTITGRE